MRRLFALALFAVTAAPAFAQSITIEADQTLWCGSAFYWLSTDASDSGADAEADRYMQWSEQLMQRGIALLRADKLDNAQIEHIADAYDRAVLAELGTPKARHDVTKCPLLVDAAE